jgi:hypothetical protein
LLRDKRIIVAVTEQVQQAVSQYIIAILSRGRTVAAFAVTLVLWHCECGTQSLNNTEEKQQNNHHQRDS